MALALSVLRLFHVSLTDVPLARTRNCAQYSGRRFPSPEYYINKAGENCARARRVVQISVFSQTKVSRIKTSSVIVNPRAWPGF